MKKLFNIFSGKLRILCAVLIFSGVQFLFITEGFSYVLTGPHILYKMISKLGKPDTILVTGKLKLHNTGDPLKSVTELSETVRFLFPEKFRSDVFSDVSHQIFISSFENSLYILNNKIISEEGVNFDVYKDILLYRSVEFLRHKLKIQGIDVNISSLGRSNEGFVYIIGAQYPDEETPQLVVDKTSFLPVKWLIKYGSSDDFPNMLDIRYLNWRKNGKSWYPGKIEFYTNGQLVREFETDEQVVNPSFADNTFDILYYMSLYSSDFSNPSGDSDTEKIDEVQKTIDDFNKIYE